MHKINLRCNNKTKITLLFGVLFFLFFTGIIIPEWFNIYGEGGVASLKAMRYSFVMVGIWWFGFSHIAFYHLPRGFKDKVYTKDIFFNGYRELKIVWRSLRKLTQLKRYLVAFFVFSMSLQTVMIVAAYFGEQEISWSGQEKTMGLIISILLIQIIAVFGALLSSKMLERVLATEPKLKFL